MKKIFSALVVYYKAKSLRFIKKIDLSFMKFIFILSHSLDTYLYIFNFNDRFPSGVGRRGGEVPIFINVGHHLIQGFSFHLVRLSISQLLHLFLFFLESLFFLFPLIK